MAERRDEKLLARVAERLCGLRKARGLTQAAVYEDTNVHIGQIEAKHNNISITTLSILCDYYETTLEEFFKGIGK